MNPLNSLFAAIFLFAVLRFLRHKDGSISQHRFENKVAVVVTYANRNASSRKHDLVSTDCDLQ